MVIVTRKREIVFVILVGLEIGVIYVEAKSSKLFMSDLNTMWKFQDFSIRFYVKSILENLEVLNLPFLTL